MLFEQTKKCLDKKALFTLSNNLKWLIFMWHQSATTVMTGGTKITESSNMKEK